MENRNLVGGEKKDEDAATKESKKNKIKRPQPLPIGYNQHGINQSRKVLYRNFHEVSGKVYLIEISRVKLKVFIVLFENF
jgi:hypothetical protein